MKNKPTFLLLFGLLAVSTAFGQTKLQIANSNIYSLFGQITSGDSTTIAYNSNLQPNLNKTWKWAPPSNWVLKSRVINHTYDAEGRLLYSLTQEGDDVNGWVDVSRTSFTFDAEGRELSVVLETWDGLNWLIQWASYKVYDTDGKLLSSAGIDYRYIYHYNAEDLLVTQTYEEYGNGVWMYESQVQYTYFPNSTLVESESTHVWDFVNNVWLETGRELFSYYPNEKLFQTTFGHWNGVSWENSSRTSLSYDSEGYQTETLSEKWEGNTWANQSRTSFSYDVNYNPLVVLSEQWDGGNWVNSFRQLNEYDAEFDILNLRLDLWDGAAWGLLNYRRFHYAEFVKTNTVETLAFDIFPNPANTSVTIQGEDLRQVLVFDAQGRLVHLQNLQGQVQENIQLGNLLTGNYLFHVLDRSGKTAAKPLQIRR
jgi:hypothetical protein